jgi:hypothetical protein
MNKGDPLLKRAQTVKRAHEARLMSIQNVIGVGIGYRQRRGHVTGELAIVVLVEDKVPPEELDQENIIPSVLDGIPVDVQVVGKISAGEDE